MNRVFAVAVCVLACLLLSPNMVHAQSKGKKSAKQLKSKLSTVNAAKGAIKKQIRQKQAAAGVVITSIVQLDNKLEKLEKSIEITAAKLQTGKQEQMRLGAELNKAMVKLDNKRQQARTRLKRMYIHGEDSPVLALVAAKDLGELAVRRSVMERIAAKDRELFDELKRLSTEVEVRKKRQDALVKEIADLIASQKQQNGELKVARKQKAQALNSLHQQANELRDQYAELDRESDRIANQLRALTASGGGYHGTFGGRFIKPANGPITSGFGYRFHPILKRSRLHAGVDIAAGYGGTIRAAASGLVVYAGYRGGYGNAVIIDHGSGLSTLYGHCSRLFVSSGQTVRQGQSIGAVGSTGLSTGPHLHFEVRKNGTPVNPMGRF